MDECPYCGSKLDRAAHRRRRRTNTAPGAKSTGSEVVRCPECGGIIDGFAAH